MSSHHSIILEPLVCGMQQYLFILFGHTIQCSMDLECENNGLYWTTEMHCLVQWDHPDWVEYILKSSQIQATVGKFTEFCLLDQGHASKKSSESPIKQHQKIRILMTLYLLFGILPIKVPPPPVCFSSMFVGQGWPLVTAVEMASIGFLAGWQCHLKVQSRP